MKTLQLEYIKRRRQTLGISLQEMAEWLGFKNASTYLKYEAGTYAFKAEQLPGLAGILNCEINDFFAQKVAKTAI
ncbi:helix-turn-helix domain-containing protein [Peribacillus loiseleuriae]|uniref:DNA-binding protein n=1 Tax=Peribacillus loiseleuriae TaxID=1679170 RepID=A0A0K9GRB3_9BACI|nr:helix-turn-helix transcriptional regulator [Peribacillus loiseleuriae]KMY49200.1 DNA-binding protein [Peribacillus loiseleuriae]